MRGSNVIKICKEISADEKGKKQLDVFKAFVESGLSQFEGVRFEATLELKELAPEKKEKKS